MDWDFSNDDESYNREDDSFRIPHEINKIAPWLSVFWVRAHSFVPIEDFQIEGTPLEAQYFGTPFGIRPWGGKSLMRAGDVLIYKKFEEWDSGGYQTDRFAILSKDEARKYYEKSRDLIDIEVVVPSPKRVIRGFELLPGCERYRR